MNLEFDDSNQMEIHFTQKGLRKRYKVTIGGFFDRHGGATRVDGMKFLFGAEESRSKSNSSYSVFILSIFSTIVSRLQFEHLCISTTDPY